MGCPGIEQVLAVQANLIELSLDCGNYFRVAMTDVEDAIPAQAIEIAFAVIVVCIYAAVTVLDCTFGAAELLGICKVQIVDGIFQRFGGNRLIVTGTPLYVW